MSKYRMAHAPEFRQPIVELVNAQDMTQQREIQRPLSVEASGCMALVNDDSVKNLPWLQAQRATGRMVAVVDAMLLLQRDDRGWHAQESKTVTVADTVRAGDCFLAGLWVALRERLVLQAGRRADHIELYDARCRARALPRGGQRQPMCAENRVRATQSGQSGEPGDQGPIGVPAL